MQFSGNINENLTLRAALALYAQHMASGSSADRAHFGDEYADAECEMADNLLDSMPPAEFTPADVDEVTKHYMVAALWSTTDGNDGNLDDTAGVDDVDPKLAAESRVTCSAFMHVNMIDALLYRDRIDTSEHTWQARFGHDLWLTRAGHGAGFWDRGLGALGDRLSEAASKLGNQDWYLGEDGKVYA